MSAIGLLLVGAVEGPTGTQQEFHRVSSLDRVNVTGCS